MAKTLKYKHRNRVWRDAEGDVWFWDVHEDAWVVITFGNSGGEGLPQDELDTPVAAYGPFKKLFKIFKL